SDATPSGMRRNVSLELMDFRDPNAVEEPAAAPPAPTPILERSAARPSGTSQGRIFASLLGALVLAAGAYWYFVMRPAAAPSAAANPPVASPKKTETPSSPGPSPAPAPRAEAAKKPEPPAPPKTPE